MTISKEAARKLWEHYGIKENIIYWDPMNTRSTSSMDLKNEMFKADQKGIKKFSKLQKEGENIQESVKQTRKELDMDYWQLSIFHVPEFKFAHPSRTPAADLIARKAITTESLSVTPKEAYPPHHAVQFGGIENTNKYRYTDDTENVEPMKFEVIRYGFPIRFMDKLILSPSLRPLHTLPNDLQGSIYSMRMAEEKQILRGTNYSDYGFRGLVDMGTQCTDISTDDSVKGAVKEAIDKVQCQEGSLNSTIVFMDFESHTKLKSELDDCDDCDDCTQYDVVGESEIRALRFKGVWVMQTCGLNSISDASSGDAVIVAVDLGEHYMGMLQDLSIKPKEGEAIIDAYGTLVSEDKDCIQYVTKFESAEELANTIADKLKEIVEQGWEDPELEVYIKEPTALLNDKPCYVVGWEGGPYGWVHELLGERLCIGPNWGWTLTTINQRSPD